MQRANYDGFRTKTDAPLSFTKADGESGHLEGYASKFWEVDGYMECTAPGSFARTIAERGPKSGTDRILFRYEHEMTIGKHIDIAEDDIGMRIEALVVDDGQWGTALRRHLQAGVPYGLSIGYRAMGTRQATKDDPLNIDRVPEQLRDAFDPSKVTVLTEIKLKENSAVSFPAVDSALVHSYRSEYEDITQRHLDALVRDVKAGRLSDAQITQLRAFAQSLPAAIDPDGEMPAPVVPQTAVQRRSNRLNELRFALVGTEYAF